MRRDRQFRNDAPHHNSRPLASEKKEYQAAKAKPTNCSRWQAKLSSGSRERISRRQGRRLRDWQSYRLLQGS
jgi:hypothetical protein